MRGDEEGLDPEDLDRQLKAVAAAVQGEDGRGGGNGWRRPKLLYTIPTGHNPTGSVMTLQRKRRILEVRQCGSTLMMKMCIYVCWGMHK